MSGYLTSLKINNLQTQLDGAILAQGFVNPLQIDLIGNGKNITGLGSLTGVDCNFTNMSTTNLQTSGDLEVETLTCNGQLTAHQIQGGTGQIMTINCDPNSFVNLNTAGRTYTGILYPNQVLADTNCGQTIRQLSDVNDVNSIQVLISNGIVATNSIEAYSGTGINCLSTFIFAPTQTYGDVVCTSVTSSGLITASDGLTINGPTVSNGSIKTTDYIITDAIESVEGNTGTINIESTANFNYPVNFQTDITFAHIVTVPDLIMGAGGVINGDPTNLYTMNNVGELNARNLRATGNVTASTAVGTPALSLGGAYPVTLQSNNTLNAAGYPALQLSVLKDGGVVNSLVYDTILNPPPSVTANTLAGVLTAGNNANLQNILGIQTLQTNQIQAGGGGLITIEDTVTADSTITATGLITPVLTLTGATATGVSYNSPYLQVKPATQTIYGNVYDSVYNKPPTPSGGGGGPSKAFPGDQNSIAVNALNFDTYFTDGYGDKWYTTQPQMTWTIPSTAGPFNSISMTIGNLIIAVGPNTGILTPLYVYITNDPTNFPGVCGGGQGMINDHSLGMQQLQLSTPFTLTNCLLSSINAVAGNNIYIMMASQTAYYQMNLVYTIQSIEFTFEQIPVITASYAPIVPP